MFWWPQSLYIARPLLSPLAALSLMLNQECSRDSVSDLPSWLSRRSQLLHISLTRQSNYLSGVEA